MGKGTKGKDEQQGKGAKGKGKDTGKGESKGKGMGKGIGKSKGKDAVQSTINVITLLDSNDGAVDSPVFSGVHTVTLSEMVDYVVSGIGSETQGVTSAAQDLVQVETQGVTQTVMHNAAQDLVQFTAQEFALDQHEGGIPFNPFINDECHICLQELHPGTEVAMHACGHCSHRECLHNSTRARCPVCRQPSRAVIQTYRPCDDNVIEDVGESDESDGTESEGTASDGTEEIPGLIFSGTVYNVQHEVAHGAPIVFFQTHGGGLVPGSSHGGFAVALNEQNQLFSIDFHLDIAPTMVSQGTYFGALQWDQDGSETLLIFESEEAFNAWNGEHLNIDVTPVVDVALNFAESHPLPEDDPEGSHQDDGSNEDEQQTEQLQFGEFLESGSDGFNPQAPNGQHMPETSDSEDEEQGDESEDEVLLEASSGP
jgi:hypothetical protein